MKITEQTKYLQFVGVEKYLQGDAEKAINKAAQAAFCKYEDLTFGQFLRACDGDFSTVLNRPEKRGFFARLFRRAARLEDWTINPSVLQVYWAKGFAEWAKGFAGSLQKMQVPQTAEEVQAQSVVPKTEFAEGMLIFIRGYFGLKSFAEAEKITMGEILIAKHDTYCGALYSRKLRDIQLKKAKAKK